MFSPATAPIGSATINGVTGYPPFFIITNHVFTGHCAKDKESC
jgi:hypothetical protein